MHVAVALRKGGCEREGGESIANLLPSYSEILFCSLACKNFTGTENWRFHRADVACCPLTGMLQPLPFLQLLTSPQQLQKSPHFLQYLQGTIYRQFVPPKEG